ncbi:MAG: GPR1/FUN34/YaaH family transporter [Pseudomonadota bacterium]|nr:GPR1/FUN34/YaaH family transporter [Pseudomonadota bacterium]
MAHEHSFATPAPGGLAALAVACFGFGAVFLGKVDISGFPLLAAWLVGGGIVQYTTAVMELKDHNITGGNVFLFFSAFFMFAAALSVFAKWYSINFIFIPKAAKESMDAAMAAAGVTDIKMLTPEQLGAAKAGIGKAVGAMVGKAVHVEGWLWMAGAGFLTAVTPAYAKSSAAMFILVILVDIVLWCIVGMDSGWFGDPKVLKPFAGWLLVIVGWIGIYMAGAVTCNTVYGKAVYYVPKPLVK